MLNLYDVVERFQQGEDAAGWDFTEHPKIRAIIRGRLKTFRRQFYWLPSEDLDDIEAGLRPRLLVLVKKFKLPVERNEGRVVSYFSMRIMGEADYLLKQITSMRQVTDEQGNLFLKSFNQPIDGVEHDFASGHAVDESVIEGIEDGRQGTVLGRMLSQTPQSSNDQLWLKCYMIRLQGGTWSQVAKSIGYRQTDFAYLKDNTARFVSRLRQKLIDMGEEIRCCICGIYTDAGDVGLCVIDTNDPQQFMIWSKQYDDYGDLDKIESKLGDVFRQYDITYVLMNDLSAPNPAQVICMRYLSKRSAFVETVDSLPFFQFLKERPQTIRGFAVNNAQRRAYQLAEVKRAHIDCSRERSREDGSNDSPTN